MIGLFRSILLIIVAWSLFLSAPSQSLAQSLSPELQKGISWLNADITASGHFNSEASAITLPFSVQVEAALTYQSLTDIIPNSLQAQIQTAATESLAQFTSQEVLVNSVLQKPIDLNALYAIQNAQGG